MRSLNLDQLRAFVEVVERGSFTAAARELNLTQPAVTHQIQELERRFKVALVERFGKRAYLTQAGEKLIEHARNLLEEDSRTQVMMRRFGDGWLGRVRVGTSMTVLMYLLPPILRQLKTDHPQLEINLKAGLTATTLQMLKTNALDLGLCAIPIEDPAFETVLLFKDELVAILPAMTGHVPKTVTPAFLSRCPLILGSEKSALRRTITDWLALVGPPPRPLMEFDNVEAIKSVVAVGLGASIVPSLSLGAGHIPPADMLVRPLAGAMIDMGKKGIGLWDDQDNFFYDVLSMPCGNKIPLRLRSMVGLIPLFAVSCVEENAVDDMPELWHKFELYRERRPDLVGQVSRFNEAGAHGRRLIALVRVFRMTKLLRRMLDETEFLSPYGVRALSRSYLDHPYDFEYDGMHYRVKYEPGESDSGMFGGNSNWRGPVWMPVNYLLIENLRRFYLFYGDDLKIECPTGSGVMLTLDEIADELCRRLLKLFLRGPDGRRPVFGNYEKFQTDPHFKDYILFHEYFHGDNGRGCGASHQTGWTGLIANLISQLAEEQPGARAEQTEPVSREPVHV